MALPATITTAFFWPNYRNQRVGVFESSAGNLYVALVDGPNFKMGMFRSTDGGDTWSEQNAAGSPGTSDPAQVCDVVKSGDTLYVLTYSTPKVTPFSMASNTWGSSTSAGTFVSTDITGGRKVFLARRSGGDYVTLWNAATQMISGTNYRRINYSVYVSSWTDGSWPSDAEQNNKQAHFDARAILLGASDRTHFFYTRSDNTTLQHRSLDSNGTFNAADPLSGASACANGENYTCGLPVLDGTKIILPYRLTGPGDGAVVRASSAATLTDEATQTYTTDNDPETANANPGSVAMGGSEAHVFWPDDATQDLYRDKDAGTGTWGDDTEHRDAITVNGVAIGYVSSAASFSGNNAIGIVYNDNGTVKYDELSLAAPVTAVPKYAKIYARAVQRAASW